MTELERTSPRERKIRQFEHYLALMEHRSVNLAKGECFLIFSRKVSNDLKSIVRAEERLVQFAYSPGGFYLDLPNTTWTPEESHRIVAERPGFRFTLDETEAPTEAEREFTPIKRPYSYLETRQAAEDTAYLFYDVWEIPLEA